MSNTPACYLQFLKRLHLIIPSFPRLELIYHIATSQCERFIRLF